MNLTQLTITRCSWAPWLTQPQRYEAKGIPQNAWRLAVARRSGRRTVEQHGEALERLADS